LKNKACHITALLDWFVTAKVSVIPYVFSLLGTGPPWFLNLCTASIFLLEIYEKLL
jgi:hypothetical protein